MTTQHQDSTAPATVDPHRGRRIRASIMLVLLCAIWGLTFPMTRMSVVDTDPIQFIALRFTFAFPVMYSFLMLRNRGRIRPLPSDPDDYAAAANIGLAKFWLRLRNGPMRNVWTRGIAIGVILFIGFAFQAVGMEYTTASRSGFFTGLLVVLTPPIAALLRTSHTPRLAWLALLPALIGTYLIADPDTGGMNIGDWLTVGSATMFAIQMVLLESLSRSEDESRALSLAQIFTIAVFAVIWSLVQGLPFHMTSIGWIAVAYNALFGSVIAVWLQTRFQPTVPAAHAGFIFALEPVFASLFAWLLLGEIWTSRALFGALFILVAMGISSLALAKSVHESVDRSSELNLS